MKTIFDYTDYRDYLRDFYEHKKTQTKSFSHRYFEQRLQVSEGYFSRLLKGEKNISDALLVKFTQILKLSKKEAEYFELLVKFTLAPDAQSRSHYYERMLDRGRRKISQITREQYELFQEPHHVAVHALVHLLPIGVGSDLSKIGALLMPAITGVKLRDSLALLERLGLISRGDSGMYSVVKNQLSTGDNPRDVALRRFIGESLAMARGMLDIVPEAERSVALMTVSVSSDAYGKIIEVLAGARQEINNIIARDKGMDRIYQVGTFVVPASRKIRKEQ
jgi:uncharacterized protein (TIGR02147 family)